MNEQVKTVVLSVIAASMLILSFSIGYSLCARGTAEICFTSAPSELASSTLSFGFEIGGYRIRVSK